MKRCLQLAKMGAGHAAPNPMVGAVLVYEDRIIGEGFHQQYGGPHAEVNCINSVAENDLSLIAKTVLYVSLEPCSHFGKTPPCTDLIIEKKIPIVVIACRDSSELVNGSGIKKLQAAGVNVIVGILEKEALELNKRFFIFHQYHRPYIILKWAQSNDDKIAGGDGSRTFISNEYTNRLVHKWRSEEAAILVGTNTALQDNPALTTRFWQGDDPVRLVIDMQLKLPSTLQLFDGKTKTIVFNEQKHTNGEMLSYYKVDKGEQMLTQILNLLYEQQLTSVIVEGGAKLLQSFINEGLWDEARVITNELPIAIGMAPGNGVDAPVLTNATLYSAEELFTDQIAYYFKQT